MPRETIYLLSVIIIISACSSLFVLFQVKIWHIHFFHKQAMHIIIKKFCFFLHLLSEQLYLCCVLKVTYYRLFITKMFVCLSNLFVWSLKTVTYYDLISFPRFFFKCIFRPLLCIRPLLACSSRSIWIKILAL